MISLALKFTHVCREGNYIHELSMVLVGLRAAPKVDSGISSAKLTFEQT